MIQGFPMRLAALFGGLLGVFVYASRFSSRSCEGSDSLLNEVVINSIQMSMSNEYSALALYSSTGMDEKPSPERIRHLVAWIEYPPAELDDNAFNNEVIRVTANSAMGPPDPSTFDPYTA